MNYRLLAKHLGRIVFAIALLMLPSALWAVYFAEWHALQSFIAAMAVSSAIASVLSLVGRNAPPRLFQREALALVSLSWMIAAVVGAFPYYFDGDLGYVDAFFESMSGFTTTGATVITDIESVPKSILFWRSFTQWLGGMGIIVLFIAVLPYLGAGGKQLFKSESPGPDPRGLRPRIKDTASTLYKLYFGFTVAETMALMIAGLGFYDALCHTFSTVATGGFSTRQLSIGQFDSLAIDMIVIVFMVCAGTNFALYFAMIGKDRWIMWRDTEWRVYISILAVCTLLVTANLLMSAPPESASSRVVYPEYTPGEALRYASFQVTSIMTGTGYGTADFDAWPPFARMLLVILMFVGGCAGSTAGGMKVVRAVMLVKMAYWRVECTFRPKTIRAVRISGQPIEEDVQRMVYAFFVLCIMWFVLGSLFMSALGLPFETAVTSVVATLNNIGPGLELVGSTGDYHHIPAVGKLFLSFSMIMGRLELFSIYVLFIPSFWRHA